MIWLALSFLVVCLTVWFTLRPLLVRLVEQRTSGPSAPLPKVSVPMDLILEAHGYESEWAKEQTLARYRELYEQTGSWDAVRRILGSETSQ